MCHIDEGRFDALVDLDDLRTCLHTQFRIQVRERFVQQEHLRFTHDGTPKCDTLALTSREFFRLALEILPQPEDVRRLLDTLLYLLFGNVAEFETKSHVVEDRHVGIEGVVLENHGDVAVFWVNAIDNPFTDVQFPLGDFLQPGYHTQTGTLATTGGTNQDQELLVLDIQVDVVHYFDFAEAFVHVVK